MLHTVGYDTGIELERLLVVAHKIPEIVGDDVPGQVGKAGPVWQLHPVACSS